MDALRSNGFFVAAALLAVAWIGVAVSAQSAYAVIPLLLAGLALCAGVIQRLPRWGVVTTATLGFACGLYLFLLKLDATGGSSMCNIDQVFDCDRVNSSAYSEVAGTPIALIGAAFYAGLVVAGILGSKGGQDDVRFGRLTFLFGLASLAYSLWLAWASVQLGVFCVVCITMYLANALLVWGGLRMMGEARRAPFGDLGALLSSKELGTLVVVFVLAIVIGRNNYRTASDPLTVASTPSGAVDWAQLYTAPRGPVELQGDEPCVGRADATFTVVEYADFGCPHCARATRELKELVAARPDVRVCFKYFPLSGTCNPALPDDGSGIGQDRCAAALAAECARRQDRFWEMSQQLFTNIGHFEPQQLRYMAEQVGVDGSAWDACMVSDGPLAAIKASAASGAALEIRGTPALYVRGVTGTGWVEVTRGVPAILKLVEAASDGVALPRPDGT